MLKNSHMQPILRLFSSFPYRFARHAPLVRLSKLEKMETRTYEEAINRLNSLQSGPVGERKKAKLDASAITAMKERLGRLRYEPSDLNRLNAIHVSGTKGKGTTCAYANSILSFYQKTGWSGKVGLYTSPHLTSVRDRIQINSEPIPEELFVKYFFEVWNALGCVATGDKQSPVQNPTYFRFLTLLSFYAFLKEKVDVAIYEVGVGGAWDSTNILEAPLVTGVTSLSIDHTRTLGKTIEDIAWHKAGIFKTGSPAFSVAQTPKAMTVLRDQAQIKEVDLKVVNIHPALRNGTVSIEPNEDYQRGNASLAISLVTPVLEKFGLSTVTAQGDLRPEIIDGLEQVVWRGRTEIIHDHNRTWYIDGAHTKDSLKIAGHWFAQRVTESAENRAVSRVLIFNHQSQRDPIDLLSTLYQTVCAGCRIQFQHVIFCTDVTYKGLKYKPDLENRNADLNTVASLTRQKSFVKEWKALNQEAESHVCCSIEEAIEKARTLERDEVAIKIFVTGDMHLIGGLISILDERVA